jgi:hypothetical protein
VRRNNRKKFGVENDIMRLRHSCDHFQVNQKKKKKICCFFLLNLFCKAWRSAFEVDGQRGKENEDGEENSHTGRLAAQLDGGREAQV